MSVFSQRPFGYKFGAVLLSIGIMLFVLSFSSPYWYNLDTSMARIHGGLWQNCVRNYLIPIKTCDTTKQGVVASDWMSTVQAMQCIGVAGLFIALIYATFINFVQRYPRYTRLLETFGVLSSIIGFASGVIFVSMLESDAEKLSKFIKDHTNAGHYRISTSWALGLTIGSSILCLVASVIVGVYNDSIPAHDTQHHGFSGYADPETGVVYPVIIPTTQEVFYIPGQAPGDGGSVAGGGGVGMGFQHSVVPLGFQCPPPYESVVGPSSAYAAAHHGQPQYFHQK